MFFFSVCLQSHIDFLSFLYNVNRNSVFWISSSFLFTVIFASGIMCEDFFQNHFAFNLFSQYVVLLNCSLFKKTKITRQNVLQKWQVDDYPELIVIKEEYQTKEYEKGLCVKIVE